jgi:acetoin utilization deacetylase AcuC-like enzyme
MSTAIYTHPACLAHDTGPGHPESPARLVAVLEALDDARFAKLARIEAPLATREQLARVHDRALVDALLDEPVESGWRRLDPDTVMSPGSAEAAFRAACERIVLSAIDAFAPELVMISAGFDAHRLDPLANLALETDDYAWITKEIIGLAARHAKGRIVSSLEGGYSLTALRESAAAHVAVLAEQAG